jgi:hypothetical protein
MGAVNEPAAVLELREYRLVRFVGEEAPAPMLVFFPAF